MRKPVEFSQFPTDLDGKANYGPYRGVVRHVVDGDTLDVLLDVGFQTYLYVTIRLLGVNTPELSTPAGRDVKAWLQQKLPPGTPIIARTLKDVLTFGRYVAEVQYIQDGVPHSLAEELLTQGLAQPMKR